MVWQLSPMCEYRRIVDVELSFIQVVKLIDNILLILVAFGKYFSYEY